MLKKIEPEKLTFQFSDGQEVLLKAPTLAQMKKADTQKDDFERLISLLIDMSDGEMDKEFINSLPTKEVNSLGLTVAKLVNFDEKN